MVRMGVGPVRLLWVAVSLLAIGLAWWGLAGLDDGLEVTFSHRDGVPLRLIRPPGEEPGPAVIIGHGFSGSQQLLLGYGYALARAGYASLLLDFAGSGANGQVLAGRGEALQANLASAHAALVEEPTVAADQVALLGHSMGSGAVLRAGIEQAQLVDAVVAVSPTDADVTPARPPNLLLMAGQFEGRFVDNARELLARAGGPSDDFASGTARALALIPTVEHITILFSSTSQNLAVEWLDRVFGRTTLTNYRDTRLLWYGLHLIGWTSLALAVAPALPAAATDATADRSRRRRWLGLVAGPLLATALLALLGRLVDLGGFLGLAVGGLAALWLLIVGLVWLLVGYRPQPPSARSLLWGLAFFALLWVLFGLAAQFVIIQWWLIPVRLLRWPLLALLCLPWKLAAGYALHHASWAARTGWWAGQSAVIVIGLLLAAFTIPGAFFLALVAPVVPLVLLVETTVAPVARPPWAYGLGAALFFGWLLAALFALV